jgi:hypothetical protein
MAVIDVECPGCGGLNVVKYGRLQRGEQRYRCCTPKCERQTFVLNCKAVGRTPEAKAKIVVMAMNETGWILGVSDLFRSDNLLPFAIESVESGSEIRTDGWGCYAGLQGKGFYHQIINMKRSWQKAY